MSTYFSNKSLAFLRALQRHNNRTWFQAHKPDYDAHVRAPFKALLTDLQPDVLAISAHYRSEPGGVGGSLFRIARDTRFANDKSPYKAWQGARLFHARHRERVAPSFYLHLQPGNSFVGAGLWHPEPATLRGIRSFIVDNPAGWERAAHAPAFEKRYDMTDSEALKRLPRGFDPGFRFIDDLRLRNIVALRRIDDAVMLGPRLRSTLVRDLQGLAPLVDYLCAALELEF